MYVYICMYIYTHIHTYMHTFTYMHCNFMYCNQKIGVYILLH